MPLIAPGEYFAWLLTGGSSEERTAGLEDDAHCLSRLCWPLVTCLDSQNNNNHKKLNQS